MTSAATLPWILGALLWLLAAPFARAAGSSDCDVVSALTDLSTDERTAMLTRCRKGATTEPELVRAAIFRLVAPPAAQVGALVRLLGLQPGAPVLVMAGTSKPRRDSIWARYAPYGLAGGRSWRAPGPEAASAAGGDAAPDVAAAQRAIARLAARLAATDTQSVDDCAELRDAVAAHVRVVTGGRIDGSPFLRDDASLLRCLGASSGRAAATPFAGVQLLALKADNITSLVTVAATPDLVSATRLDSAQALSFERHRYFVVAVPTSAAVAAIARLHNLAAPAIWRGLVSFDRIAWEEPPPMTCISFNVDLSDKAAFYLDGVALPVEDRPLARLPRTDPPTESAAADRRRATLPDDPGVRTERPAEVVAPATGRRLVLTLPVTRTDHHIDVVECTEEQGCYPRYRDTLDARSLQRRDNDCLAVRLDLGGLQRETTTILDATQGDTCLSTPLRVDMVRRVATEYLSRPDPHHEFRDLTTLASMTDALATLRGRLNRPGGPVGPETGADGADLIGGAAREAWRQGINVLLSFQLQCIADGGASETSPKGAGEPVLEGAWRYRIEVTQIALSSMFARGHLGGGTFDLDTFIEVESEEFTAAEQLQARLELVLERSLGRPYVHLLHARVETPLRRDPELRVAAYVGEQRTCGDSMREQCPTPPPHVTARRIGASRPAICVRLHQDDVRAPGLVDQAQKEYEASRARAVVLDLERDLSRRDALARVDRTRLRGSFPGWYIVLARASKGGPVRDAICVELTASTSEVWSDVTLSTRSLHLLPRANPDELYLRARVGYTRYLAPWLGLGAFIGYAYVRESLDGRPAWEDLGSLNTDALHWQRHALLTGGVVDLRLRTRVLPFDPRLRVAPTLSLGVLDLREIPTELEHFLGVRGGRAPNIDLDVGLHFDLGASYDVGRVTIHHNLLVALEALDDRLRRVATDVRSNAGLFVGVGIGLGGAP